MKNGGITLLFFLVNGGLWLAADIQAQSGSNVVVSFSTAAATLLNSGFAGFSTEILGTGIEDGDTNLQQFAQPILGRGGVPSLSPTADQRTVY